MVFIILKKNFFVFSDSKMAIIEKLMKQSVAVDKIEIALNFKRQLYEKKTVNKRNSKEF